MGKNKYSNASISVFLSLVLVVILSLLGTMVEVTRGKVCKVHGSRVLQMAGESLLSEYSRPLYKEYRLFFLEDVGKSFEKSMADYAAEAFSPKSLFHTRTDLFDMSLTDLVVVKKDYVADHGCKLLKKQIVSFMKRRLVKDGVRQFRDKLKSVETLEDSAVELEKRVEEQKEAARQNVNLRRFMQLIDGVTVSAGRIKGEKSFVKMLCNGEKKPEHVGITDAAVWKAIQNNVVRIPENWGDILKNEKKKKEYLSLINRAKEKTEEALGELGKIGNLKKVEGIPANLSGILTANQKVLAEVKEIIAANTDVSERSEKLKKCWERYDTSGIVFDYSGIHKQGGGENPMDHLRELLTGGAARLVLDQNDKLSEKRVKNPDQYQKLYQISESKEDYKKSIKDFVTEETVDFDGAVKDIVHMETEDYMILKYLEGYFSMKNRPVGKMKKCLDYEWEYMVCGKGSDKENLEQVINRMILMRTLINTGVISASTQKRETAYAAALAAVGFTGMEPLVRLTQTIFLVIWGMSEALVDVAGILEGRQVPLVKSEKDIRVNFADLFVLSRQYIESKAEQLPRAGKNDFGYQQYLMLFLLGTGSSVVCRRMMDLMEWNIRRNHERAFSMGTSVGGFRVRANFSMKTKFFTFPYVQNVLQRKLEQYGMGTELYMGYST